METAKIRTLKDKQNNIVYPQTVTTAVISTSGNNIQEELDSLREHTKLFKGTFENETAILAEYPNGEVYDPIWVINKETDTMWLYDTDIVKWVNSFNQSNTVTRVNGKLGDVVLVGMDINTTINQNEEPITKSVHTLLQEHQTSIENIPTELPTPSSLHIRKTNTEGVTTKLYTYDGSEGVSVNLDESITTLVGTEDTPIYILDLPSGYYRLKGHFHFHDDQLFHTPNSTNYIEQNRTFIVKIDKVLESGLNNTKKDFI